ncbi:hypothetical protein [Gimesia panareensis]|uniref:hypothetical protein n=1 Tax=Gimesia panareensis TaxID=2527978 RepID=UPI0011879868|nr:hypothetical protein [Gimesia panareensis]QDU47889.1 hypothetical protein Pan110_01990 [Gimesia panareensis]
MKFLGCLIGFIVPITICITLITCATLATSVSYDKYVAVDFKGSPLSEIEAHRTILGMPELTGQLINISRNHNWQNEKSDAQFVKIYSEMEERDRAEEEQLKKSGRRQKIRATMPDGKRVELDAYIIL